MIKNCESIPSTEEEIDKLPTIMDVIEFISSYEKINVIKKIGIKYDDLCFDYGKYFVITNHIWTNIPCLMPGSQSPFLFMRGQNEYYPVCKPSIYREPANFPQNEFELISRIKSQEFINVIKTHPIIKEYIKNYELNYLALAQHYGFPTEYLDITNSKWVAAFFATTEYKNNQYIPVGRDFKNGFGIMYIMFPEIAVHNKKVFDNFKMVGFHYLKRPTQQNAIVLPMSKNDNFNENNLFCKILFRHDKRCSEMVYNMSYNQERFIPKENDIALDLVSQINDENYEFSWTSICQCHSEWQFTYSDDEIKQILKKHNVKWHLDGSIHATLNKEMLAHDCEEWERFGREDLKRRVIRTPLVCKI